MIDSNEYCCYPEIVKIFMMNVWFGVGKFYQEIANLEIRKTYVVTNIFKIK